VKGHETEADLADLEEARAGTTERPDDAEAWIRLGRLLHEPGHRYDEAVATLNKALEADPNSVKARFWLARLQVLHFFEAETAERLLRDALEIDPNCAECLTFLISARWDLGAPPDEVLALARRAVQAAPEWRAPRQHLVVALINSGRRHEARQELKTLQALLAMPVPEDPLDAEFETSVTGRSSPTSDMWLERVRQLLDAPPREN
jgi:tetratricopeptide (TPR) repeat protein